MSTYENEPIPRNGGAIGLDYLGCLRPQEISQPTINGSAMSIEISWTYVRNLVAERSGWIRIL